MKLFSILKTQALRHLGTYALLSLLLSCSGVGGLGFGTEIITGTSGSSATGTGSSVTTGGSDDSGSSGSGSGTGDSSAAPQASIPLPNAKSELTIAYAADDSGNVPYVGYAGAADYDESYKVAVSTEAFETTASRVNLSLARNAYADDFDSGLCDETNVTCCPINADGSFECYAPTGGMSVENLYVTMVDGDGEIVTGYDADSDTTTVFETIVEPVNYNALWFAQAPKDLAYVGYGPTAHIGVLGQDALLDVSLGDTAVQVIGDYTNLYLLESAVGAEQIASATASLSFRVPTGPTAGVGLWTEMVGDATDELLATDTGDIATVEYTNTANLGYTTLKTTTHGDMWFGRQPSEEYWSIGSRYEFVYSTDKGECDPMMGSCDDYQIPIFDKNASGEIFNHTVALDVDINKTTAAVFKDTSGGYRVSMGYYNRHVYPIEEVVMGSTTSFPSELIDISFIKDQSDTANGSIAILDKTNGRLYFKDYFANIAADTSLSDIFDETTLADYVEVGSSPVSMALNTDKNTMFVLNEGDNTISAFNVKDVDGNVLPVAAMADTKQTINLSDYFAGKSLTFTPNKLISQKSVAGTEYLMVGMEGILGAAVFEAPDLPPPPKMEDAPPAAETPSAPYHPTSIPGHAPFTPAEGSPHPHSAPAVPPITDPAF